MDYLRHKSYRFNQEKDLVLQKALDRQLGFQIIIDKIMNGKALDIIKHYNQEQYPNQYIIYVPVKDTVYAVPCVKEGEDGYFLKTIYPSRKATKFYLPKKDNS